LLLLPDSYTISFIAGDIVEGLVIGEGGWRVCEAHWHVWHMLTSSYVEKV